MTHNSSDLDVVERTLAESFATAQDDARWAGDGWTDPLGRLRRAQRSHRRRLAIAATIGAAALAGGVAAAIAAIPTSSDRLGVTDPAAGGQTGTGLDWFMTSDRYNAYVEAHPSPSPYYVKVPSPAPMDDELRTLKSDVAAALPADARLTRADAADGGNAGEAVVNMTLRDGTPVVIERQQLHYPLEDPGYNGASPAPGMTPGTDETKPPLTEVYSDPEIWPTGTAYSVVTGNVMGMGVQSEGGWNGPFVYAVTADGWFTRWTAPVTVERLLGWARASDEHFTAGR